ncbi:MAG: hypothetical protein ABS99_01875 [Acetobacteraceae bacterium SCN 69-10]|nr:hypothetical protein [Rhodospirillales bacterium]ODU61944.1 MAG: hypothetical protein ABS99_01875 [Acetobacteraceae bacterium SCN 69-10]OJY70528.1 MAG: hypothetical protein BGP12_22705 [Rhodospirillales bacterium 70-18]
MPTPASNHAALALLRADPDSAMAKYGFVVGSDVYTAGNTGGACLLSCEPLGHNIFKLTAKQGFGDYLFPYVNGTPGVGDCTVPQGQEDGTIVTTGGMNGCALQVNRFGANFHFYHDNNGVSIAALGIVPPGNMVARVNYKSYAGPLELGKKLAEDAFNTVNTRTTTVATTAQYQYFCLNIHVGGRWKVYYSSILETGTTTISNTYLLGTSILLANSVATTRSYSAFKPTITPLITSFDDA